MWKVLLYRVLSRIVSALPQATCYAAARILARILCVLPTERRRALRENIAVAHGADVSDPRVRRDTRRAFANALLNYIDLLRIGRSDTPARVRAIAVPTYASLDEARAGGKGVILISAHLGNLDTVVQVLALRGQPVLIPAEAIQPPKFFQFMQAQREALGIRIEPIGPDTMRKMTSWLRSNGIVVILCDRDVQGTGATVSLFGKEVTLPTAAVLLALRTGAPVLGGFGYRHADGSLSGRLVGELSIGRSGARGVRAALAGGMREIAALLEREIRRDPGQWVVQQPLFSAPRPTVIARLQRRLAGARPDERTAPIQPMQENAGAARELAQAPLQVAQGRGGS